MEVYVVHVSEGVMCRWAIGKDFSLDLDPFLVIILTLSVIHAHFVSSGDLLHYTHNLHACTHACICTVSMHACISCIFK